MADMTYSLYLPRWSVGPHSQRCLSRRQTLPIGSHYQATRQVRYWCRRAPRGPGLTFQDPPVRRLHFDYFSQVQ